MGATPDYNGLLGVIWGDYWDGGSPVFASIGAASNVIVGSNPAYAAADFTALYPQFANIPVGILNTYITLASVSLMQGRYQELWPVVMGLFIAHYVTLWAQSAQSPNATIAQIAASGLAIGIKTSKSAGDVSVGVSILNDLGGWGQFQLTLFGQQFASIAKAIGSAPILLY